MLEYASAIHQSEIKYKSFLNLANFLYFTFFQLWKVLSVGTVPTRELEYAINSIFSFIGVSLDESHFSGQSLSICK